jgi:hypothetical protein
MMLRHLRKTEKPRALWIAAVCLNQADDDEKDQQFPLMGEIYKQARKVRVWLGDHDPEIMEAVGVLRELSARQQDGPQPVAISFADLQAVSLFLNRPWSFRRWVLQEVFVNPAVVAHCGELKIPWASLIDRMAA